MENSSDAPSKALGKWHAALHQSLFRLRVWGAGVKASRYQALCDTTIAKAMHGWLAEGNDQHGAGVPEFRNELGRERTTRIDGNVGEDIAAGGSKDEYRRLRFVLETIAKTEWPGRKVSEEYAALVERNNRKALEDEESGLTVVNRKCLPAATCALQHLGVDAV